VLTFAGHWHYRRAHCFDVCRAAVHGLPGAAVDRLHGGQTRKLHEGEELGNVKAYLRNLTDGGMLYDMTHKNRINPIFVEQHFVSDPRNSQISDCVNTPIKLVFPLRTYPSTKSHIKFETGFALFNKPGTRLPTQVSGRVVSSQHA
jgi:hypothetical protein